MWVKGNIQDAVFRSPDATIYQVENEDVSSVDNTVCVIHCIWVNEMKFRSQVPAMIKKKDSSKITVMF